MPETGVDKAQELMAWATIVVEKWKDKIHLMNIHDTDQLYDSMKNTMIDAGSNGDKIEFIILLYGKFVDMGVGREMSKGNSGDLGFTPERKPQPWYTSVFFWQVHVFQDILKEKYAYEGGNLIFALLSAGDAQYADQREKTRNRSKRNYDSNRAKDGRWNSNNKWKPNP